MRLFLIGLVLLNIVYFLVPEKASSVPSTTVSRGDWRLPLLIRLDESSSTVSADDKVSRDFSGLRPPKQANDERMGASETGADSVPSSAELQADKTVSASEPQISAAEGRCFTIGPYRREAKAELMTSLLQKEGFKVDWRSSKERRTRGYSVFLPSYPSYEAAEQVVQKLAEQGVNDYYILTDPERRNSVSLGFFTLKSGSEKRVARLRDMGYQPKVEVRFDEIPVYWLDYESAESGASELFWKENSDTDNVELLARECK